MTTALARPLRADARLFAQQLDVAHDRVLLADIAIDDYRQESFLDQRILTSDRRAQWLGWTDFAEAMAPLPTVARYIFHIGHVGSTLVSRLLAEVEGVLPVREPQILRQFAELAQLDARPESLWPPGQAAERLETSLRALSRGFPEAPNPVVKASSFVSEIAGDMLGDGGQALFLYVRPDRYVETILAGDNSRQELALLAGNRLTRLHTRIGAEPWRLWDLPEATRAAMTWACEMTALEAAAERAGADRVLWIDFDDFLAALPEGLAEAATFLNIALTSQRADQIAASPVMQRYSKAPEHGYSPDLRTQLLAQTRAQRGEDIAGAVRWLESAASAHTFIGQAYERANL